MRTVTFRLEWIPDTEFVLLRKSLVLLPGIKGAELHPGSLTVTFDPAATDEATVRSAIARHGVPLKGPLPRECSDR